MSLPYCMVNIYYDVLMVIWVIFSLFVLFSVSISDDINILIYFYWYTCAYISVKCIPRTGIADSLGILIFNYSIMTNYFPK